MHATLRRIRTRPGQVAAVAHLIEGEYLPMVEWSPGFVSYTLIDLGDDEISSLGVFATAEDADRANELARSWTVERLSPLVDSPLDVGAGAVLVDHLRR